jgi:hypothetical protein
MNHDDTVNAAILALTEAFKANMTRGRCVPEDFEAQMAHAPRFILDAIQNNQADQLGVENELVTLPAPVLIQLVADAIRATVLEAQKADAEQINRNWSKRWREARAFMKSDVPTSKKYSVVLGMWGMIGDESGEGGNRRRKDRPARDYARMARHYFELRVGKALRVGKKDTMFEGHIFEPHSHDDAVRIIELAYQIHWDALERACLRKKICLVTKAEVFPIP